MRRDEVEPPLECDGSNGVQADQRALKNYAVAGAGSAATSVGVAAGSTMISGALAALSFGFRVSFTAALGLGAAFTTFRATLFAAFTLTGGFLSVGAALAFFRFAAGLRFGVTASAFFALSAAHRFF